MSIESITLDDDLKISTLYPIMRLSVRVSFLMAETLRVREISRWIFRIFARQKIWQESISTGDSIRDEHFDRYVHRCIETNTGII